VRACVRACVRVRHGVRCVCSIYGVVYMCLFDVYMWWCVCGHMYMVACMPVCWCLFSH